MAMEYSHIWLAQFPSKSSFDDYFNESYEDDETPINLFASEQAELFYDHDWVERSFDASAGLRQLIQHHSYAESYIEKVLRAATSHNIRNANSFIMADRAEFSKPRSITSDSHMIWYLGCYKCDVI
ncbi:MAG: immunity 22 family protein [Hyphomicrobiaceae bacterium]|nr:immunity 22 family protein [Hyphomicrobiaceae bacterium]